MLSGSAAAVPSDGIGHKQRVAHGRHNRRSDRLLRSYTPLSNAAPYPPAQPSHHRHIPARVHTSSQRRLLCTSLPYASTSWSGRQRIRHSQYSAAAARAAVCRCFRQGPACPARHGHHRGVAAPALISRLSASRRARVSRQQLRSVARQVDSSACATRSCAPCRGSRIRFQEKRWHRDRMVAGTFCGSVVAKMNNRCTGGVSYMIFSRAALKRRHGACVPRQ